MPWTPLHAALGETTTRLDFDLIDRACTSKVPERADLDWKRDLPLTPGTTDPHKKIAQQTELAKDIAAMANSGGGMIVYGIAQAPTGDTSAADRIVPVGAVDDATTRAIRQVAGNLIYPPVTGLQLLPVAPAGDPLQGVLVLLIPDSPESPHLVHPKQPTEWFGVPYRHGPDTEWMVERQVASAYRAREERRRSRFTDFDERFDAFVAACGGGIGAPWIVAVAVPDSPHPRPRDLQHRTADKIIERAWSAPMSYAFGPRDLTRHENTRRGLQRFYRVGSRPISAVPGATARGRIEVHGDGTVAAAFSRGGAYPEGLLADHVAIPDIEQTGIDFFCLLWSTYQVLRVTGDYTARFAIRPTTEVFRRADPSVHGHFADFDESQRVRHYGPVEGPILATEGLEGIASSWLDLVNDAINQAGAGSRLDANDLVLAYTLD